MTNEEITENIQDTFNSTDNMNVIREALVGINDSLPSAGPLVFKANVTQSGTGNPTYTVLENTVGTIVSFGRGSIGNYKLVITDAFPEAGKVALSITSFSVDNTAVTISVLDSSSVEILTWKDLNSFDNNLLNSTLLIEVYP